MKQLYLYIVVISLSVAVKAAPELKGHPDELKSFIYPDERTVTISGNAKEKAYSDKAIISLVIVTEKSKLADAIKENSSLRAKVSSTLTSSGLNQDNIKTSKFSTSPQFGWFSDKPKSYEVINRMAISIKNEEALNLIAKISDDNKEISLASTEFEHTLKAIFEEKLKKKALSKVMAQKDFYESTLGLKLKAVSFYDRDVVQDGTRGARDREETIPVTASRMKQRSFSSNEPAIVARQTFDEVEYSVTISVEFEIVSGK